MMESIQTALSKVKFYNTGRVMMVTKKGMILANPTSGLNGKTLKESKDPLYTQLVSASNRKKWQGRDRTYQQGQVLYSYF